MERCDPTSKWKQTRRISGLHLLRYTFQKIRRIPAIKIKSERIRINNFQKIILLIQTWFRYNLRLIWMKYFLIFLILFTQASATYSQVLSRLEMRNKFSRVHFKRKYWNTLSPTQYTKKRWSNSFRILWGCSRFEG